MRNKYFCFCYTYIRRVIIVKYNIRGDKLIVTEAIKEYIEEKLDRLNKYYGSSNDIICKVLIRSQNNL